MNASTLALLGLLAFALPICQTEASPLTDTGRNALASHNLSAADAAFASAVAADADDEEANVLYALTRILSLETTPDAQEILDHMGVSQTGRDVLNWTADAPKNLPTRLNSRQFKVFAKNHLLPEVIAADANLAKVTTPTFKLVLSAQETGLQDVVLDYGDILMLRAMAQALIFNLILLDNFNTAFNIPDIEGWFSSNMLTMEHLLSAYPDLLKRSGSNSLTTAGARFSTFVNTYVGASEVIRARITGTDSEPLFAIDPDRVAKEAQFRASLLTIQSSLTAPVNFDANTPLFTGAFFASDASLRDLLPVFKFNHPWPGSFSDPTFAGVFPGNTQDRALAAFTRIGYVLDRYFPHEDKTIPPEVKFTSPKANARIHSDGTYEVAVAGTASGKAGVARVELSHMGLGSTFWSLPFVATGSTSWSANLTGISPGVNVVFATAYNAWGKASHPKTLGFTYVATGTVNLQSSGGGKIVSMRSHIPSDWTAWLPLVYPPDVARDLKRYWSKSAGGKISLKTAAEGQLGMLYTVKAVPDAGYIFDAWYKAPTMDYIDSIVPKRVFWMVNGYSAYASFIRNPFPAYAGVYKGSLQHQGLPVGFTSVSISNTGAFTGKVMLGGRAYNFRGRLDAYGRASEIWISRGKQLSRWWVDLTLDLSNSGDPLSVNVYDADVWNQVGSATATIGGAVLGTLNLQSSEGGRISSLPGGPKPLGKSYTVKAMPDPGFFFDGWYDAAGGIISGDQKLIFTMADGYSAYAKFIPNRFIELAGNYNAITHLVNADWYPGPATGLVSISITKTGAFTGKLIKVGAAYTLSGSFDHTGQAEIQIPRGNNLPAWLGYLDLDSNSLSFLSYDENWNVIDSVGATLGDPSLVLARHFTLDLLPDTDESMTPKPQGHGYGLVTTSAQGNVRVAGKLADGTPFTQSGFITGDGSLPLFVPLYSGSGQIAGDVQFDYYSSSEPGGQTASGDLVWDKPQASTGNYQKGLEAMVSAQGSAWQAPTRANEWLPAFWTFEDLQGEMPSKEITLGISRIINVPADENRLKLRVDFSNGSFNGSFLDPGAITPTLFRGILNMNMGYGAGFYLNGGVSGAVLLQ